MFVEGMRGQESDRQPVQLEEEGNDGDRAKKAGSSSISVDSLTAPPARPGSFHFGCDFCCTATIHSKSCATHAANPQYLSSFSVHMAKEWEHNTDTADGPEHSEIAWLPAQSTSSQQGRCISLGRLPITSSREMQGKVSVLPHVENWCNAQIKDFPDLIGWFLFVFFFPFIALLELVTGVWWSKIRDFRCRWQMGKN